MFPLPWNDGSWVLYAVKSVCEIGVDIDKLGLRVGWKLVFELAEGAKNCCVSSLFVDCHPDGFFAASRAGEHGWEFLLDYSDYSTSSSAQPFSLYTLKRGRVNN